MNKTELIEAIRDEMPDALRCSLWRKGFYAMQRKAISLVEQLDDPREEMKPCEITESDAAVVNVTYFDETKEDMRKLAEALEMIEIVEQVFDGKSVYHTRCFRPDEFITARKQALTTYKEKYGD